MMASWVSDRLRLNSRMPLPIEAPTSGSRLAPNSSSTTTMISMISVKPRLPMGTPLENRARDQVCHHHPDQRQQRDVQADRPQGEVYHQKIGRNRAEIGRPGAGEEGAGRAVGQGLAEQCRQGTPGDKASHENAKVEPGTMWPGHQRLRSTT